MGKDNINVIRIDYKEFISLTDLARYADEDDPRYPIQNWMRNKDVISYLGLWESIHNENFKGVEFDTFKNEAGSNKFKILIELNRGHSFITYSYLQFLNINVK